MHIPDGYIGLPTSVGAGMLSVGAVTVATRQAGRSLRGPEIPLAGVSAAFLLVVQMLNFPIGAGTSGHVIGAALVTVLLGPRLGLVVMSVVIGIQALAFADGGITALGLNVLNMGVLAVLITWGIVALVSRLAPRRPGILVAAAAFAGWLSVVAASAGFAAEYAIDGGGAVPATTVLGAMVGVHAIIGIAEGLATAALVTAVLASRPDLVYAARRAGITHPSRAGLGRRPAWGLVAVGAMVSAFLFVVVVPHASRQPDGLERVASVHGLDADRTGVAP